ncbi:hypothetical protein BG015_010255 [Linnemannia schmuckeri]|uniref:Uncharacterized protein n=1 Tax=Linnemannia schmuckeri TaxID=64567 RepID=A0A9P5V975_9FUNG|nr:hypothetical protein BG015_010255 [Linnemannia schmuckeri]
MLRVVTDVLESLITWSKSLETAESGSTQNTDMQRIIGSTKLLNSTAWLLEISRCKVTSLGINC